MTEIEYELYHHGVKGMRWGHRKKPDPAKQRYKQAKKNWREARREFDQTSGSGWGIHGLAQYTKAENKRNKADMDFVSEKARYKGTKSAKGEMRTYVNEMSKQGLMGSLADRQSGGRSTRLYNRIKKDKGKEYADTVLKKTQDRAIGQMIGGAAVALGAVIVSGMLSSYDY